MRLSGLDTMLRARGFDVVEHPGWERRGYKGRDLTAIDAVFWHHTATPYRTGQSDYPTAGYIIGGGDFPPWAHLGLGRTGKVHMLAAGLANHAGRGAYPGIDGNEDGIGIEVESPGGRNDLTDAQVDTILRLAPALSDIYGIPAAKHVRHQDWTDRKIDLAGITTAVIRAAVLNPTTIPLPEVPYMSAEDAANGLSLLMGEAATRSTKRGRHFHDNLRAVLVPSIAAAVWAAQVGPDTNRRSLATVLVQAEAAASSAAASAREVLARPPAEVGDVDAAAVAEQVRPVVQSELPSPLHPRRAHLTGEQDDA